jgi:hemoglobin/transferrin/lactoferrin receptor protein
VLNLRSGWEITDSFSLAASIENVTDQNYRVHRSGVNEPGQSRMMTLDWQLR